MQSNENKLILVDTQDNITGYDEKMIVHIHGKLHRAFSIFIFNSKGELLLQQRNPNKYHSGGKWSNSCCGHPLFGENIEEAAVKRLEEEFGFRCNLKWRFKFNYRTKFANNLFENEIDHVFFGHFNNVPNPNPIEISDWKWIDPESIAEEIQESDIYTYWFKYSYNLFIKEYRKQI